MADALKRLGELLAASLPQLKSRIQLAGLAIIVVAALMQSLATNADPVRTIAAGAIGVCALIFGQLFESLERFPVSRRPFVFLSAFVVFCIFLAGLMTLVVASPNVSLACLESLRTADNSFESGQHDKAYDYYVTAESKCPDSAFRSLSGQAASLYMGGRFADSSKKYLSAFEAAKNSGAADELLGTLLVGRAYAFEALREYELALDEHISARKHFKTGTHDFSDTIFSEGRMHFALWASSTNAASEEHRQKAIQAFERFLKYDGTTKQWAYYNLSCLDAAATGANGSVSAISAGQKLIKAAELLAADPSSSASDQKSMFVKLLGKPAPKLLPTRPFPCPHMDSILANCNCKDQLDKIVSTF